MSGLSSPPEKMKNKFSACCIRRKLLTNVRWKWKLPDELSYTATFDEGLVRSYSETFYEFLMGA
jgi:hypothetical protein